jgi:hypothetical protein
MNTILLQPTDVLFFRDGRPMNASLAGHGAAWPLPNVINAAFHAALHRADLEKEHKLHEHRQGARGKYAENASRDRRFGSLLTAGPFPVSPDNRWFFPRPLDMLDDTLRPALVPDREVDWRNTSSLPNPLRYAVSRRPTPGEGTRPTTTANYGNGPGVGTPGEGTGPTGSTKEVLAKGWLRGDAFKGYLRGEEKFKCAAKQALDNKDFCDAEHNIGIGIDPTTGVAGQGEAKSQFYTAHYLRLRDGWRLGVCAKASDKEFAGHEGDLVKALFLDTGNRIIVGGQQRNCTADCRTESPLPLPLGLNTGFHERGGKYLVKWVLLSPAVWPTIEADTMRKITAHTGGWLPNWIDPLTGDVCLKEGNTSRREYESREAWRERVRKQERINAQLVAAIVPKPVVVTGYAMADESNEVESERNGGAQSTHLAVPAGAVYYFEAHSAADAVKLANALNWHGATEGQEIKNRRSTLLGEKGFGLGVCGTWDFFKGSQ